jgi:anaerobic nitric oxide reductase transcription regulator
MIDNEVFSFVIGDSKPIRQLKRMIERAAGCGSPVLISGQMSTGKLFVGQDIHKRSKRADSPFVFEHCLESTDELMVRRLFGYTGEFRKPICRRGAFSFANGGTIYLADIDLLSAGMQAQLVRVLEQGKIRPFGAKKEKYVDVRVIAATCRDLRQEVEEGRFRADLYVLFKRQLYVPTLRERGMRDIEMLVDHFLSVSKAEFGMTYPMHITRTALDELSLVEWTVNVVELTRVLIIAGQAVRQENGELIEKTHILRALNHASLCRRKLNIWSSSKPSRMR